jgi:hypothetical protein
MPVEFWITTWKLVLIVGVGLFAALAVVVSIGGAFDVRNLLRTLREQHAQQQAESDSADGDSS